ncbi:cytidylate kinase [Evansella vedderi]|uniref:Cytidylate kinase n=1 Tax=Evansella vedderi TaxID=38282 RepID=A0ABU0A323_9BACI|nr:(d)CMP kinase [Evansella vedderi]MDQ0257499.1 cytidylate kinase [Evansella vedderi]
MRKQMNIAIDGPAGAGKSTVAKMVAEKLSFIYIDTGAMYRALTYEVLNRKMDVNNEAEVMGVLNNTKIQLLINKGSQSILLNGEDVSEEIRSTLVTNNVSYVAKHLEVRKEMVKRQQQLADEGGTVMDGRDIGTMVLPNAELKIFLTASVDERARRRHEEYLSKGQPSDLEKLKTEISRRDKIDSEREIAPLRKAEDAIEINSTSMTIEDVVQIILSLVEERRETVK